MLHTKKLLKEHYITWESAALKSQGVAKLKLFTYYHTAFNYMSMDYFLCPVQCTCKIVQYSKADALNIMVPCTPFNLHTLLPHSLSNLYTE